MLTPTDPPTLDARDYLRPIWVRKYLIVALVAVTTVGTYVYYDKQPDRYEASTDVFLSDSGNPLTPRVVSTDREIANQARLLRTRPVARRVAAQIGYNGSADDLLDSVSVTRSPDSDFVTVTTTASSGSAAAELANAFAQAFIEQRGTSLRRSATQGRIELQRQLREVPSSLRDAPSTAQIALEIQQLKAIERQPSGPTAQLGRAAAPSSPFAPNPTRNAIFAFALSLMLGALAAYGLDRLDRRVTGVDGIRDLFGAPVLVSLPRDRAFSSTHGDSHALSPPLDDLFQTLRTSIEVAARTDPTQVLLVTSAAAAEGKSTVVRNLGIAYREVGRNVVIVEADLRRPVLAASFGLQYEPGLSDVLTRRVTLSEAVQPIEFVSKGIEEFAASVATGNGTHRSVGGLALLASGTRSISPGTLLASPHLAEIIASLRHIYDIILIDSPPLLPVSDTLHILPVADGVALVSRLGKATPTSGKRVAEILGRFPSCTLYGVIANDVTMASEQYGYAGYEYSHA